MVVGSQAVEGVVGARRGRSRRGGAATEVETEAPARYAAINGLLPVKDRRMLQFLSRRTRVPQSEYLREAIRDLLRKYRDAFEGSPYEDEEPL